MSVRYLCLAAVLLAANTAFAQLYGQQRQVRTKTLEGEVKEIRGSRMVVEIDGKTGPLPVDRNTQLSVNARGDLGFLRPGVVVVAAGTLRSDGTIAGADFTVHPNAKQTVDPQVRRVNAADPQITVAGQVVSLEPFKIKALDSIAMVKGEGDDLRLGIIGVGEVPPAGAIQNAVLTLKLRDGKPQDVKLALGGSPKLLAAGDWFSATFREDRPNVASRVYVRKEAPLKSGAKPGKKDGDEKKEDEKKEDAKSDDDKSSESEKSEGTDG